MTVVTHTPFNTGHKTFESTSEGKFLSVDEIIDIYQKGCNDGFTNYVKKTKRDLIANLTEAQQIAESFLGEVNSKREICKNIFLRVVDLNKFDLMFAIDPVIFYNPEKSKKYYNMGLECEDHNTSVSISFLPFAENLNINMLIADSFMYFYGKKQFD